LAVFQGGTATLTAAITSSAAKLASGEFKGWLVIL